MLTLLAVLFAMPGDLIPSRVVPSAKPRVLLLSQAEHDQWMSIMPRTVHGRLEKALSWGPILYNHKVMPPAYQHETDKYSGFRSTSYNVAPGRDPFGHANGEHPWNTGLGLDDCVDARVIEFISIPPDAKPATWRWVTKPGMNEHLGSFAAQTSNPPGHVREVIYAPQTHTSEVVAVQDKETNKLLPQLVRSRFKQDDGTWAVSIEAPFATAAEFITFVNKYGSAADKAVVNNHYATKARMAPVRHVHIPLLRGRLPGSTRGEHTVYQYVEDDIPELSPELVRKILAKPFVRIEPGKPWLETTDGKIVTYAPTTQASFSFVPKNYKGGFIPPTKADCMACHSQTLKAVTEIDTTRDWYGRVRGSDTVFSFHFEDPGSISYNGIDQASALRKEFVESGLIEAKPKD